jgi:HSP20 family protein
MAFSKVPSGARLARSTPFDGVTRFSESSWTPNTDVFLTDECLVIQVEVAGMRREDLTLKAEGNRLRVQGKRDHDDRPAQCKFILMEIDFGTFQFYIDLPAGYNLHKAKAVYQNGFLRISVPIASRADSEKIDISIPTEDGDE